MRDNEWKGMGMSLVESKRVVCGSNNRTACTVLVHFMNE